MEGEVDAARKMAAGERTQAEIDVQTRSQHSDLLSKVEQINVLTDSNRLLRQERDGMQPRISELEQEVRGASLPPPLTVSPYIVPYETEWGFAAFCL